MTKSTYSHVVGLYVLVLAIGGAWQGNPYGQNFLSGVLPALLLLASLQWLLVSSKLGWQITGACAASAAALMILFSRFQIQTMEHRLVATLLIMLVQLVALWTLSPDSSTKSIVLAETLAIAFLISLGIYLSSLTGELHFPRSWRFLFWSPLAAMCLWINGVASGWKKSTQIIFICLIAQNSIGFIDLGASLHASWMYGCALLFVVFAIGFVIAWAESLNQ